MCVINCRKRLKYKPTLHGVLAKPVNSFVLFLLGFVNARVKSSFNHCYMVSHWSLKVKKLNQHSDALKYFKFIFVNYLFNKTHYNYIYYCLINWLTSSLQALIDHIKYISSKSTFHVTGKYQNCIMMFQSNIYYNT